MAAYSTRCRKCGEHFRLEDILRAGVRQPGGPRAEPSRGLRRVSCFQCGTELEVSPSAQSTMCKRCSDHDDLRDYEFTSTVSKNFKTRGRCVLHEGACLLNTDSTFGHAILKGKIIGRIAADELEIYRTAEIKGGFMAGMLIIPADTVFRWRETVALKGADIAGDPSAADKEQAEQEQQAALANPVAGEEPPPPGQLGEEPTEEEREEPKEMTQSRPKPGPLGRGALGPRGKSFYDRIKEVISNGRHVEN